MFFDGEAPEIDYHQVPDRDFMHQAEDGEWLYIEKDYHTLSTTGRQVEF